MRWNFHSYAKVSEANEVDFSVVLDTGMKHQWFYLHQETFYDLHSKMIKMIRSQKSLQRMNLKYTVLIGISV